MASQLQLCLVSVNAVLFINISSCSHLSGSSSFENRQTRRKSGPSGGPTGERNSSLTTPPVLTYNKGPLSLQDFLPPPTVLPTIHELDLFRSASVPFVGLRDSLSATSRFIVTCAGVSSRSSSTCSSCGSWCCSGNRWSSWRPLPPSPRRPCWLLSGSNTIRPSVF